ncbi:pyrroloquinoline quinone biosynthesis protein PqqB [Aquimarina atlantica]|uniref:Pyrroloquinoline quinone biosynthesis protein PqqB n=1 Tax=Aquimarina atlantica TaxID=1317122 RepID=A0A023BSR1_9FLAO|nr:MBL fold metallo-hydrolase [Aquimarina atlantica]EZH72863.1 pyrroloquinoline quinone biosynthesis protein PqqB [Aquimarina atlantica]
MKPNLIFLILSTLIISCKNEKVSIKSQSVLQNEFDQYITVLGIAQDGGFPHINNTDEYIAVQKGLADKELVTALGVIDKKTHKKFMFEATPDMPEQLALLDNEHLKNDAIIDGVFLTHAHIGHYTGLMHFGREAMGANKIPVYAMPRMQSFLETNGPWSQLVSLQNIAIKPIQADSTLTLTKAIQVIPFLVPHRDEYSETVGYKIIGNTKKALFIPDINKWSLWERNIVDQVKQVDYAFIDATFFKNGEIPRPMSEVPHPFIEETIVLFENEPKEVKSKIIFIHFNHSNPVLQKKYEGRTALEKQGYHFANTGDVFPL